MDDSFVTRHSVPVVWQLMTSKPHRYLWDGAAPPQNTKSSYDESYLSLGHLRLAARFSGVFPMSDPMLTFRVNTKPEVSSVAALQFQWMTRWSLYTLLHLAVVTSITGITILDLVGSLRQPLDRTMAVGSVMVLGCAALINVTSGIARASHWPLFYRRFRAIDVLLDLHQDDNLRRFTHRLLVSLFLLIVVFVGMAVFAVVMWLIRWVSAGLAAGALVHALLVVPALVVPELLFAHCNRATSIRMARVGELLEETLKKEKVSVRELEKLRISFELLAEAVRHSSLVLGPALGVSCLLHTATIGLVTYLFLQRPAPLEMQVVQAFVALLALARILPMCFLADQVADEAGNISCTLHSVSTKMLSGECANEIYFFIECVKQATPISYSVMGFWAVDKGFLNTIATVILTYIVTILQFNT